MTTTSTHSNTRQVRLPIRTHVRLHLLAALRGITVSTLVDDAIVWWLTAQDRTDLLEATAHLPEPKPRLPALSTWDPATEEDPPSTRQIRLPVRSHTRLMALTEERRVFAGAVLDDIMEAYGRHVGTGDIAERTAHLPKPPRLVARSSSAPLPPADRARRCIATKRGEATTWHIPFTRDQPTVCDTAVDDEAPVEVRVSTCRRCRSALNKHGSLAALRRKVTAMPPEPTHDDFFAEGVIEIIDSGEIVGHLDGEGGIDLFHGSEIDGPVDDGEHEAVEA